MVKVIEKAAKFLNENKDKRMLVIFDTDGDGIGAAAIIAKTMKKISNKAPEILPRNHGLSFISKDMFQKIKDKKIDVIITVDVAADEKPEYVLKLSKNFKILIIDHHQVRNNLNKYKNILHVNPEFWKSKVPSFRYCTSKIVYDICSKITDVNNLDWLAGIGIVNDKSEDYWKDFLKKVYRKYRINFSKLKITNNIITSGYEYSGNYGSKISFKACVDSYSPDDILKGRNPSSKKLMRFYNAIEKEISIVMKNWRKYAEILEDKKLIILKLDTRFSLNSTISTIISFQKPNYTVVVVRKKGEFTSISLRRQDKKIDCGKIAVALTKKFKDSVGGGHAPAAGIHIRSKDWKIFRIRLINSL
jgi:single-stranded DNA-specific DHH superfamily exonuclease